MLIYDIADLEKLALGIRTLTGETTDSLWVEIGELPVRNATGEVVGYFIFNEKTEYHEFITKENRE